MSAGVSLAAFTAVHRDYISKTRGATPGGFVWDMLTYSHPDSRARLDSYFSGSQALSGDSEKIGAVVMATAKRLPKPRSFQEVRKEAASTQSADCRQESGEYGIAVNNTTCGSPGKTCVAAVRTHRNWEGGANWTLGRCTCNNKLWTDCQTPDGIPLTEAN